MERFWGKLFCTNGTAGLGVRKEMNGNGMTSCGQMFSLQEMIFAIKRMVENKAPDDTIGGLSLRFWQTTVQIVSKPPAHSDGARFTVFGQA